MVKNLATLVQAFEEAQRNEMEAQATVDQLARNLQDMFELQQDPNIERRPDHYARWSELLDTRNAAQRITEKWRKRKEKVCNAYKFNAHGKSNTTDLDRL